MEEFFDQDRLVQNIAFLLGIDSSQIRVVSVVRETITKRRRRQEEGAMTRYDIDFEIGNPPPTVVTTDQNDTTPDNGNTTQAPPTNTTVLSFEQLEDLTEMLVDVIQTGELTSDLNATIVNAVVMEPEPEPVDPNNGTRATPATGGPQPGDNGTDAMQTFYDMQLRMEMEAENETQPIVFTIPTQLYIERDTGNTGVEGKPLAQQPIIVMFDNFGSTIQNLGLDEAWRVRAVLVQGPQAAFVTNSVAELLSGRAEFEEITFSYPGKYRLSFMIEFPESANFSVVAEEVMILPRDLSLSIITQPGSGNTTFPLYPYPTVELREGGVRLEEHGWRNSTWFVRATLQRNGEVESLRTWDVELTSGAAQFTGLKITDPGRYTLLFTVFTYPASSHVPPAVTSQYFEVALNPLTRLELTFDEDYTIIGENGEYLEQFVATFVRAFLETFPSTTVEVYNITITRGSIIVSVFLTSRSAKDLQSYVETVTTSNGTLVFEFRGIQLSPSAIVMDPSYPIEIPEDELTLILVTVIPSGTVLLLTLVFIVTICHCYRRRRNSRSFKVGICNE